MKTKPGAYLSAREDEIEVGLNLAHTRRCGKKGADGRLAHENSVKTLARAHALQAVPADDSLAFRMPRKISVCCEADLPHVTKRSGNGLGRNQSRFQNDGLGQVDICTSARQQARTEKA